MAMDGGRPAQGPGDLRHSYWHQVDVMQAHMGRDQIKRAMAETEPR